MHWFENIVLKRTVQNLRFYTVYRYQISFHSFVNAGRRQKTPASEKNVFITHSTAVIMSFIVPSFPLAFLNPTGSSQVSQGDEVHSEDLHYRWVLLCLGSITLKEGSQQTRSTFTLKRDIVFIFLIRKQVLPLFCREILSPKILCNRNILGKIFWRMSTQTFCSEDMQRCETLQLIVFQ